MGGRRGIAQVLAMFPDTVATNKAQSEGPSGQVAAGPIHCARVSPPLEQMLYVSRVATAERTADLAWCQRQPPSSRSSGTVPACTLWPYLRQGATICPLT